MYYKNIAEAIGHTPLIELSKTSPKNKVKILAKLEGQNLGGSASIKDRIAKYMIEKAEQSGQLTRDKTILEATSGNTGISLALLGHIKGYKVTIVMPDNMSLERQRLLKIYGAELVLTDGNYGIQFSIDTAREMIARDDRYFMPDQFNNPANPLAHYETTAVELLEEFPYDKIDVLIAGIGTGGTIMGISRRLSKKYPNIQIIGVEPPAGDSIQGLRCIGENPPPFWDNNLIKEKIVVSSQQAIETTLELLDKEAIFAGQSSGAVIHQAIKVARDMEEGNIVAVLADGGWKYLNMPFWDKNK